MNAKVALLLLLTSILSGCNKDSSSQDSVANGGAKISVSEVRLGYFPNLTHGQAVMGITSGEFESMVAPAKFTPRQFNAGPALIEALFAHQIDIGYVGPGPAISAFVRSHGEGIRVISGSAANGVVIVARPNSGINSMADLAGKKIATPQQGNTQDIAARHYLTATLKQADTNNVLPIPNADQVGMMSRSDIDASWAPEPWGSLLIAKAGAKLIGEEKDLWPNKEFSLTVVVTTPEFLTAHADVVQKILLVHESWTQKLAADAPQYASQLDSSLATLTGKQLPPGVTADALKRVKFTDVASDETFQANAQWAYDLKFAKEKADLSKLQDLTILHKLQQK